MMQIGNKIRELRLENNLTQEELANRVELTKGYISQLENDLTSPSIATLIDILNVLGTDLSSFFDDKSTEEKVVFSEDEFFEKIDENQKYKMEWIVPNALKYEMEPIIITLGPDGKSFIDNPHSGEEFGYVLEGVIYLVIKNKKHKVSKGETFYFLANKEHYIMNASSKQAKVLWISTPPMF